MDRHKSLILFKQLKGKTLSGYEIIEYINNGKSAAVFQAEKEGQPFALKIFDNELIERFGHEMQTMRIEQEIALKDHTIQNLVKIYEGGNTNISGQDYYYIVMEFINGLNLKEYIYRNDYGSEFVLNVLSTLNKTTEDLLSRGIAHRDIKPENIMVDATGNIVLMDLGVLKLIQAQSFSDEEEKAFVGTLRYSPPEFLQRKESDTVEGWRAVNRYQIGATLHDLIMKVELFHDKVPYTNLVMAIMDDIPRVSNSMFSFDFIQLVRDMLTKDWERRLQLVTDDRITKNIHPKDNSEDKIQQKIEKILQMRLAHNAKSEQIENLRRSNEEIKARQEAFGASLIAMVDEVFYDMQQNGLFTTLNKSKSFLSGHIYGFTFQHFLYRLEAPLEMGFKRNIFILVGMRNDEKNYTEIGICGVIPSSANKYSHSHPIEFFTHIATRLKKPTTASTWLPKLTEIFKGIAEADEGLKQIICISVMDIIEKCLLKMEPEVTLELEQREQSLKSPIASSMHIVPKNSMEEIIVN